MLQASYLIGYTVLTKKVVLDCLKSSTGLCRGTGEEGQNLLFKC